MTTLATADERIRVTGLLRITQHHLNAHLRAHPLLAYCNMEHIRKETQLRRDLSDLRRILTEIE